MTEAFLSWAMKLHGDAVYRLALCRLQNAADAEDVYQETFLRLFQEKQAPSWEAERLKAWLLRVAINKCTDIARKRRHTAALTLEDIPNLSMEGDYGSIELWDAVSRLPEKYRIVFHLYYGEGYKTQEIADLLSIPAATVRVNLSRARATLRKELTCNDKIS